MTSGLALLTVSLLALAGNEISHAESTSSPYPRTDASPAEPGPGVPPPDGAAPTGTSSGSTSAGSGAGPAVTVPAPRTSPEEAGRPGGRAGDAGRASTGPSEPDEDADVGEPSDRNSADADLAGEDPAGEDPADDPAGDDPMSTEPADDRSTTPKSANPAAVTAAERYGWGAPLPGSDEFGYTGPPDPAKWNTAGECWAGHAGNGKRCASRSTVDGSKLVQTGLANGDSGWVASKVDQRYGRWEARVRSVGTGPVSGRQYHPLLIIWPTSNRWPQDGEYDFLENGAPGEDCAESFIHYPHGPGAVQQVFTKERDCGAPLSEWHNVAFEWTPNHVRGYVDGRTWFDLSGGAKGGRKNIQDMPSGHLTIQLDNFFGGGMQPATYEVDWVRIYGLR